MGIGSKSHDLFGDLVIISLNSILEAAQNIFSLNIISIFKWVYLFRTLIYEALVLRDYLIIFQDELLGK